MHRVPWDGVGQRDLELEPYIRQRLGGEVSFVFHIGARLGRGMRVLFDNTSFVYIYVD